MAALPPRRSRPGTASAAPGAAAPLSSSGQRPRRSASRLDLGIEGNLGNRTIPSSTVAHTRVKPDRDAIRRVDLCPATAQRVGDDAPRMVLVLLGGGGDGVLTLDQIEQRRSDVVAAAVV